MCRVKLEESDTNGEHEAVTADATHVCEPKDGKDGEEAPDFKLSKG